MMAQQLCHEMKDRVHIVPESNSSVEGKIQELSKSVSEVYKYELLTTNQYLKQMELVLEIFQELSESITNQ